jgi:hypothetical protein
VKSSRSHGSLEFEQNRVLQQKARDVTRLMTELVRRLAAAYLPDAAAAPAPEAFERIVALGESAAADVAEEHDRYLAEVLAGGHLR